MRRGSLRAFALLLFAAGAAADIGPPSEGFRVAPYDLRAKLKTVCLRSIESDVEIADWRLRSAWLEQFLAHELEQAGFSVADSKRTEEVAQAARTASGGLYDRYTGQPLAAKRAPVELAERERLASELHCDALLQPSIQLVRVRWQDGRASWDHIAHSMGGGSGWLGTAAALTLWLELRATDGKLLLARGGGIETLSSVKGGGFLTPAEYADIDPARLLASDVWNARAVLAALGALTNPPTQAISQCIEQRRAQAQADKKHREEIDPVGSRVACELAAFQFVPPPEEKTEPETQPSPGPEGATPSGT